MRLAGFAMDFDFKSEETISYLVSYCESLQRNILADQQSECRAKKLVSNTIKEKFVRWLRTKNDKEGLIIFEKRPKEILRYILSKKKIRKRSSSITRKLEKGYLESTGYESMVHIISNQAWNGSDSKKIYLISNAKRAFKLAVFTFVYRKLPHDIQMWWGKKANVSFPSNNHRNQYYIII